MRPDWPERQRNVGIKVTAAEWTQLQERSARAGRPIPTGPAEAAYPDPTDEQLNPKRREKAPVLRDYLHVRGLPDLEFFNGLVRFVAAIHEQADRFRPKLEVARPEVGDMLIALMDAGLRGHLARQIVSQHFGRGVNVMMISKPVPGLLTCVVCGRHVDSWVICESAWSVCYPCGARGGLRLLSIDPSIGRLGWSISEPLENSTAPFAVIAAGSWAPSGAEKAAARFLQLVDFVRELMKLANPTDVMIETPGKGQRFGAGGKKRSFDTMMVMQRASAICFGVAAASCRTFSVDPQLWKGSGSKAATAQMMNLVTGGNLAEGDEADALGLAAFWITRIYPVLVGKLPAAALPEGLWR